MEAIETWDDLIGLLVHRLAHDVSGRATGLTAIRYIVEDGDDASFREVLAQEQERMAGMLEALRRFPHGAMQHAVHAPDALLEPVAVCARWLRLAATIDLDVAADAASVRLPATPFQRALLLVLASGRREHGRLRIAARGNGGELVVTVGEGVTATNAAAVLAAQAGATLTAGASGNVEVRVATA